MTLLAAAFLLLVLAWITWTDSRRLIIPDLANAMLFAGGVVQGVSLQNTPMTQLLVAPLVAGGLAVLFRAAYKWARGLSGLGLGDVKFLAAASTWLGLWNMPLMVLISCFSALASVVLRSLWGRPVAESERVPFGPHLCLGLAIAWGAHVFW